MGSHKARCWDRKLFILYINDICKVSKLLKLVLFADDTNIFSSGDNLKKLQDDIMTEMSKLKVWFDSNKLSLNLVKTKFMLFGNCKRDTEACISIEGVNIERVFEIKFLGVIIDDKISWKPHIKYLQSKISRSISVINKAKMFLDFDSLYILYCSLVPALFNVLCGSMGQKLQKFIEFYNCSSKKSNLCYS